MKGVVILGSSRGDGNTRKIVDLFTEKSGFDLIDLLEHDISYYDYEHKNKNDDFKPLMQRITSDYDLIVFATPIYWYSMSGIMKVFFDRITDCLSVEKELGQKLKGLNMAMISCSYTDDRHESFALPFSESANYLGMNYLGDIHTWVSDPENISEEVVDKIAAFLTKL